MTQEQWAQVLLLIGFLSFRIAEGEEKTDGWI